MKEFLPDFQLRIENPCHENWDKMLPDEKGKFCLSCQKAVYDFTQKTKEEIIDFFRGRQFKPVCGRINTVELTPKGNDFGEASMRISMRRLSWFAYALYMVFGSMMFSCNNHVASPLPVHDSRTLGRMVVNIQSGWLNPSLFQKSLPPRRKQFSIAESACDNKDISIADTIILPEVLIEAPRFVMVRGWALLQ
jgi:hypothetical protein